MLLIRKDMTHEELKSYSSFYSQAIYKVFLVIFCYFNSIFISSISFRLGPIKFTECLTLTNGDLSVKTLAYCIL